MKSVSVDYNPYSDVRWIDFRIVFSLLDTQAAQLAIPSVSDQAFISQLMQLTDNNEKMHGLFATLEPNFWALDGSMSILKDDYTDVQTGWYTSAISDSDGTFMVPPTLTFSFSSDISSIGFTLIFDSISEQWSTHFDVATYDALNNLITQKTVFNYDSLCAIDLPSTDYRKVVFTFYKTSKPQRRVRVCECLFGIVQKFDKSSIKEATLSYGVNARAESLPSSELVFSFDNSDHKYNMINPKGIYNYLQQGQAIDTYIKIGNNKESGQWIYMGRFYFNTSSSKDEALTAEIKASDKILWLNDSICRIGCSGSWRLAEAVGSILFDAGSDIQVSMPNELESRIVGKAIPNNTSHREALRLVSQAACCTCWVDRSGILVFASLSIRAICDSLTLDNLISMSGISISKRINTIELSVRDSFDNNAQEIVYIETNKNENESIHSVAVSNPCAIMGQEVANWLLLEYQKRINYSLESRGNPALEISDTIEVYSAYGNKGDCIITGIEFEYDGGLSCTVSGQGSNLT